MKHADINQSTSRKQNADKNTSLPLFGIGEGLLADIHWHPNATAMLKLPSVAKGTELRARCDAQTVKTGRTIEEIIACVHHAARIEHLVSIGGEDVRSLLLEDAGLTLDQIGKLCRRMPPFIAEKLKELREGPVDVDSNPNGVFDTNGWSELRTRLPKFRSTLQHYAASSRSDQLPPDQIQSLSYILSEIQAECDHLEEVLKQCTPAGVGKPRASRPTAPREKNWTEAKTKFAQVLGVLRKTNRDLKSEHWQQDWIPTVADHQVITSDAKAMKAAAQGIGSTWCALI